MNWENPASIEGFLRFVNRSNLEPKHDSNKNIKNENSDLFQGSDLPNRVYKHCEPKHNLARGCNTIAVRLLRYYRELEAENEIADRTENIAHFEQSFDSPKIKMAYNTFKVTMPDDAYVFCTSSSKIQIFTNYPDSYVINDLSRFSRIIEKLLMKSLTSEDFLKGSKNDFKKIDSKVRNVIYKKDFKYYGLNTGGVFDFSIWMNSVFRKPVEYAMEQEVRFAFLAPVQMGKNTTKFLAFRTETKILDITNERKEIDRIISLG